MKDTLSLAGINSCLFSYTGPSTSSFKWQVRPSLPLLHTSFLPRFHSSFSSSSSSHEMSRRKKKKKRKKGNVMHIMRPYNENQTNLCCLACSHKDKDGLPPPLHKWFLPVQFIATDIRNKLQQNPDKLRRIVSCWCQTRMQTSGRAILGATRNFLYDKSILVLKAVALVGSVVLLGMLTLYAQAKAQAQIERHVLPPIANVVGGYLGRTVVLGKVHSVSPLGLTLESCLVGPHVEEFSCGELPLVEIRLRPVSSIQRRQLVFDAVLVQPNVLVCQKKDWSWLGIPTPTEKSHHRSALEEGLDARTKARRLARSQVVSKLSKQRDLAAMRAAKSGYVLPGERCNEQNISSTFPNSENKESETSASANNYNEKHPMNEDIGKVWSDALQEETSVCPELPASSRPSKDYRTWLNTYFSKPVPLFKHWNIKSSVNKVEAQRRNLNASASAARIYFENVDAYDEKSNDVTESDVRVTSETVFQSLDLVDQGNTEPVHNGSEVDPIKQWDNHSTVDDAKIVSEIQYKRDNGEKINNTATDSSWGNEQFEGIQQENSEVTEAKHADMPSVIGEKDLDNALQTAILLESRGGDSRSMSDLASLSSSKSGALEKGSQASLCKATSLMDKSPKRPEGRLLSNAKMSAINSRVKVFADKLIRQAKNNLDAAPLRNWIPATLDSVYLRGGTLSLLAYGDTEARVMENINGYVKLRNKYEQVDVQLNGNLQEWRTSTIGGNGGSLFVKVSADIRQQKWSVKLKGNNLFAPLLERLLEIPLDWSDGRASGELSIWASKGDLFPNLSGRLNVSKLAFQIWEAPSAFKEVSGTLFIQGQRLFLHNTSGFFGAIPLHVSGDMDLNPDGGEYRLVCQVPDVEANALMKTLKARPPMFPLAGAIKAAVYCRGPLEIPVFAGSAEICKKNVATALTGPSSAATEAIKQHEGKGAIAAFDKIPFSYASANFTFDTDNCVADVYGIRATLSDGGELRGAGNLWICPEGEEDPTSVNMDLSGHMLFDSVIQNYLPNQIKVSPVKLDYIHGEAKIHGSLLQPIFDIKWNAPEAIGAFNGVRGDINISHEAIAINSAAFTFDLSAKIFTKYPSLRTLRERRTDDLQPLPPDIEGLDFDLRMRGFDFLGLVSPNFPSTLLSSTTEGVHTKLTGRAKFQGRVAKSSEDPDTLKQEKNKVENKGITGEILLSGLKLNQFLVAPHLSGNVDIFPSMFKLNAFGRTDEHLMIGFRYINPDGSEYKPVFKIPSSDSSREAFLFSLERGQLHMHMDYQAGHSAKLEVRNLQLDELELASLRGIVQKAEAQLNFQKRKGHGVLSVRRPRFSGVQGESLDLSCRWSGDVITLERSVLEQASSRYELQGEYVLPGPRDHAFAEKETRDGGLRTAMAGQLGSFITSLGRWRLQLEVPGAEVTDLLPVARLLSRSSDPSVVSRSKELFMQGMQHAGFCAQQIKEQLEHLKNNRTVPTLEEGLQESIPLPGLAELKGHWHGTFDASGGGNGDTSADFDFHGEEWEWGTYKIQRVTSTGSYNNNEGLHLDKIFIQKDAATLHADGTLLGPKSNLHFAVLNFPVGLVPPLVHAVQSSTLQPVPFEATRTPITSIRGILYMEGDLRGPLTKPQCDVQVRLLDGVIGGVELGRAEVVASITSSNRFNFNAKFEPAIRSGHVHVRGSLPLEARGLDSMEDEKTQEEVRNLKRPRGWNRSKSKVIDDNEAEEKKLVRDRLGDEGWEAQLAESLKELDWDFSEKGAVQMDAAVKDGGMMLITALSPHLNWLQGNADLTLQVRGTVEQPTVDGVAAFHRVSISSPVLPRPLSNFGGTIRVINNQLRVEGLEGRVGRKGRLHVKGRLPLRSSEASVRDNIELKADLLEVRGKNVFSGQVDSQMRITRSILEPEVSGMIKLSHGEAYLPQEKGVNTAATSLASSLSGMATGGKLNHFPHTEVSSLPDHLREPQSGNGNEDKVEEKREHRKSLISVGLKNLKVALGPELRVVYPLILNFAVSGELELNGLADPQWIKPRGTLTFENGDVNLVATQLRLNRDHPNRAKFEPEQGLDPTLDLALVGADWQLKIQGRARNWQDNLVVTSTRSGEQDAFTRTEAARVFESQLADSLLEGNGQLAFKKLAAATVETLMPKIEGKGEFGQARWRLVSAPQIPNLLSLDPTTDPFKSLANLSFGTEVEVQLGKRLQASVVRQMKESEMATQWTLIYHLSNKLRILFSSIPSVDNRLLFEYSATSQN